MSAKLTDNRNNVLNNVKANVEKALKMIGTTAEGYAKLNCAVDTGRLRASITHIVKDNTVHIGTNVEYAAYVEFGTGRHAEGGGGTLVTFDKNGEPHEFNGMKAHSYLRPAVTDHIDEYMQMIGSK